MFHGHKDFHKIVLCRVLDYAEFKQTECQRVAVCWHMLFSVVGLVDGLEGTCFSSKVETAHQRGKSEVKITQNEDARIPANLLVMLG